MTPETIARLRALATEAGRKIGLIDEALKDLPGAPVAPGAPVVAPSALPHATLTIGTVSARKGALATLGLRLTAPFPVAGIWLNVRHSPRLEFVSATSKVKSRAFKSEKVHHGFRALIMFTTDLATGSAEPGAGLEQLPPNTVILEAAYKVAADSPPGKLPVQAAFSGTQTPGVSETSWPCQLLTWQPGGAQVEVIDGGIEVQP